MGCVGPSTRRTSLSEGGRRLDAVALSHAQLAPYAGSYQIQGTPSLIMFLDGNEVGRVEGPSPTVASVLTAVTQPFESGAEDN